MPCRVYFCSSIALYLYLRGPGSNTARDSVFPPRGFLYFLTLSSKIETAHGHLLLHIYLLAIRDHVLISFDSV